MVLKNLGALGHLTYHGGGKPNTAWVFLHVRIAIPLLVSSLKNYLREINALVILTTLS